ncbi:MAG: ABC transporter permease [Bacteriovoracaceae bacterium]
MIFSFANYFVRYIFFSRTRQKLLFLAFIGLFLSAAALLGLQSAMDGLQQSQIGRSKAVFGNGEVMFKNLSLKTAKEISLKLKEENIVHDLEYQIELLLKHDQQITPVIVHGLDVETHIPSFLDQKKENFELIIPFDIAYKLNIDSGSKVELISPAHVDYFFEEIPRSISLYTSDIVTTRVPEADQLHVWVPIKYIHFLIEDKTVNQIVIRSDRDFSDIKKLIENNFNVNFRMRTWEEKNQTLVYALNLESTVMFFLFVAMTFLVSLCITSGLLIFFRKVRTDFSSFWILGTSKDQLERSSWMLINFLSIISVGLGLIAAYFGLGFFEMFVGEIMPDIFVDRKIPINITWKAVAISFTIPYLISILFSWFTLRQFKKGTDYLDIVRTVG